MIPQRSSSWKPQSHFHSCLTFRSKRAWSRCEESTAAKFQRNFLNPKLIRLRKSQAQWAKENAQRRHTRVPNLLNMICNHADHCLVVDFSAFWEHMMLLGSCLARLGSWKVIHCDSVKWARYANLMIAAKLSPGSEKIRSEQQETRSLRLLWCLRILA